jgi:hypothetical protein
MSEGSKAELHSIVSFQLCERGKIPIWRDMPFHDATIRSGTSLLVLPVAM